MQKIVAEIPHEQHALWLLPVDMRPAAIGVVQGRLASVAERSRGRWTVETLAKDLCADRMQLWLIVDTDGRQTPEDIRGIVITEIFETETGIRICNILAGTGDGAAGWLHLIADLETWARSEGCHRMEAWARKGWARRLPDYLMTHVKLEKDLL